MEEESKKPAMTVNCPKCKQVMRFYVPSTAGILKITCANPECKTTFGVKITEHQIKMSTGDAPAAQQQSNQSQESPASHPPTDVVFGSTSGSSAADLAWLVQKGKHFFSKDKQYRLKIGANTIGMYDSADPSDIMIEGDRTISHRSVSITVEDNDRSYKYLLTVNKAKNPVYLNGKALAVGASLYIEPGAEFVLGSTHFLITNK